MNFVMKGDHYVGGRPPVHRQHIGPRREVVEFDSEEELEWASDELDRSEAHKTEQWSEFKRYIKFYAGQRRLELEAHRLRPCWVRCDGCGNCTCGKTGPSEWARCLCAEGKKTLSPYRIVWQNGSKKADWQRGIWEVGRGYVARKHVIDKTSGDARGIDGLSIPGASR